MIVPSRLSIRLEDTAVPILGLKARNPYASMDTDIRKEELAGGAGRNFSPAALWKD